MDGLRSLSTATLGLRGFDADSFGGFLSLIDLVYIKLHPNATEPNLVGSPRGAKPLLRILPLPLVKGKGIQGIGLPYKKELKL